MRCQESQAGGAPDPTIARRGSTATTARRSLSPQTNGGATAVATAELGPDATLRGAKGWEPLARSIVTRTGEATRFGQTTQRTICGFAEISAASQKHSRDQNLVRDNFADCRFSAQIDLPGLSLATPGPNHILENPIFFGISIKMRLKQC